MAGLAGDTRCGWRVKWACPLREAGLRVNRNFCSRSPSSSCRRFYLGSGNGIRRRNLRIAAEVKFVNGEEAKQLIAEEGFSVVDVRDITQFERAHIKFCHHIPLLIYNEDNDPAMATGKTVKDVSPHDFMKAYASHLKPSGKVQCTACSNVSDQYENMMDLTVEIHRDAVSLEECLGSVHG